LLDQFRLSVRRSVRDNSKHCENGERYAYGYMGTQLLTANGNIIALQNSTIVND